MSDEVDRFIGNISPDEEKPRKRRMATKALPPPKEPDIEDEVDRIAAEDGETSSRRREVEDGDPAEALLPAELPKPSENARSLAGMLSKYQIGDNPEFKIQLYRLLPKYFHGGVQAHGYYDEYTHPINEEYIRAEYGGGTFEVRVLGPDPKTPNGVRRYDSYRLEVGGPPNPNRLARSVQAKLDQQSGTQPTSVGAPIAVPQENPKVVEAAMKMAQDLAEREREDRRRTEDRANSNVQAAKSMYEPVVEAERRRADDIVKIERERAEAEKRNLEERLRESREELRRLEAKVESMSAAPSRSLAEDLKDLQPLFERGSEAAAAAARSSETITKSILDRHQVEIESLNKQHQSLVESLRQSHTQEISSLREAHRRELEAERETRNTREERHEEALRAEREERRRDAELYKKSEDARDKQWRDRMEQQEINLKAMWESRVETQKSNYESQLQWIRSENEQLQSRIRAFESQVADRGDLVKQLNTIAEVRSTVKNALGIDDSPPPAAAPTGMSGIDGSGPPNWGEVIQTAIENLPAIWQMMNSQQAGQPPAAGPAMPQPVQQQPVPGQVIQTPHGPSVVVVDPRNGQLSYVPKDQYDAYMAEQKNTSQRPRRAGMFGAPQQNRSKRKPVDEIPVPNMAEGLPKPPKWGEPVQPAMPPVQPATPAPQAPVQAMVPIQQPAPQQAQRAPVNMDKLKQMIAQEVAKLVHNSVENGEEPEDFVAKVLNSNYPPMVVQTIAGMSSDEVVASIKAVAPSSAGAQPMGERFVREAMAALRAATSS